MLKTFLLVCFTLFSSVVAHPLEDLEGSLAGLDINDNALAPSANAVYNTDCSKYPNVCLNWCYYIYCKTQRTNPWTVTVNRTANLRPQSDCKSPNRCSATTPQTGWPKEPNTSWSCDEQPKNTNDEGGTFAATRCMPSGENSGEGATWAGFINKAGATIPNGAKVDVKLLFAGTAATGDCGPLASPPTPAGCTPPVQSNSPGVATNGPRQR